jgi:hypothetical protein
MEFTSVTIIIGTTDETDSLKKTVDYIMENCDYDDLSKVLMVKSKLMLISSGSVPLAVTRIREK